jgi:hypothetical protein
MTDHDEHDTMDLLTALFRRVVVAPSGELAAMRAEAARHVDPALSAAGLEADAELAWIVWLESQSAGDPDEADRLDELLRALVPDAERWRRYFEAFPPGAGLAAYRRRRAVVAASLASARGAATNAPRVRYAAASTDDETCRDLPGEPTIRCVDDDGYLRCFLRHDPRVVVESGAYNLEIVFAGGRRMRGVVRHPEDSELGVNLGPLAGLRLADIVDHGLERAEAG